MEEVEVPQFFICPISLQIMKDPVTTISGITYDRQSIEQWLLTADESVCPVTKQPLPRDSDLTPNHTLRRLIQGWCVANAKNGVDQIPTPKTPLDRHVVAKIIRDLKYPHLLSDSLRKMEALASESEKNRKFLLESGVANSLISLIIACHDANKTAGLEESLRILNLIWPTTGEINLLTDENHGLIDSITWILNCGSDFSLRSKATLLTKKIFKTASASSKGRLGADFVTGMVRMLRENSSISTTKAALRVLIDLCQRGNNRFRMIEANVIFELIELGLGTPEKKITELTFRLLSQLCSCADGRAQFLSHAGGIALVTKRILRASAGTDDRAVHILSMLTKFAATNETLQEMLRVGAVSKLCMVLQADCSKFLKDKAREILRMHSNVWNNSPCIQVYLLTRYPTLQF
ncbi:hypothetical protein Nepgr_000245 [Nepenthes gracilis]|uniref:U-box domain-containing protein n=1 Tax=Nepenthes gracilis TaxID=150966 RepID=A0AAD3P2U7_NEPGR|nr:hypothetical protein Nepgr_000245 [Nepenthes gracilis]